METLNDYFNYEYLDELATAEKIYYSPSVGWDKINSKKVNDNKEIILNEIATKVLNGTYTFVPYKIKLLIKNKDSKPRKTCISTIKDKIVISAVKKYLYDVYKNESFNIPANNIINNIADIVKNNKDIYYKKIDLSSFFDNINHEVLLEKLSEKVDNKIILDLIKEMLENPQKYDEVEVKEKNILGVPQGISIATLLANIYMHELDLKYGRYDEISYFRYVDDIIILANNKQKIDEAYKKFEYDIQRRNLLLINKEKLREGKVSEGLEYLGYKFEGDLITVRKSSILRFEKSIENVFRNFSKIKDKNENQVKKFIWLINVKITGILVDGKKYGWLYYFDCINDKTLLKRMDLLIRKLTRRFKLESYVNIGDIKTFTRAYFAINSNPKKSKYLLNLNNTSEEEKRKFLKEICLIPNVESLLAEELDYRYRYNLYRTLKDLERDIDCISG